MAEMGRAVADVASQLAALSIQEHLRNGGVTIIPSLGIVMTYKNLPDPLDATPPTTEKVRAAIQACIDAQEIELGRTTDPAEIARIEQRLTKLRQDLLSPHEYYLPVALSSS